MHVLTHKARTSKEVGLSEAQMIALRVDYAGCGDSMMLSAAAFEALPQHLCDELRVSETGLYQGSPGKSESNPSHRVYALRAKSGVKSIESPEDWAYPAFVLSHDRECLYPKSAEFCMDHLEHLF